MKDGRGQAGKPWLTMILDDESRTAAGYALSFSAPSAIHTVPLREVLRTRERRRRELRRTIQDRQTAAESLREIRQ